MTDFVLNRHELNQYGLLLSQVAALDKKIQDAEDELSELNRSRVVPEYKRPQPIPLVYSEEEVYRMEMAIDRSVPVGKRDYAIILLATRLGLRLEDIRTMSFDELDFEADVIRLVQEKTLVRLELPMVPELKTAISSGLVVSFAMRLIPPYRFLA